MARSIGPGDLPATLTVARHLARMQPDVVHAHGAKGGVYGRLAAAIERRKGRKVAAFYAPHGGSLHYDTGSLSGRIYFTVERALERLTDGLIHVSAYEAETYRRKVGAPRCPAHVVRNGLRTGRVRARRSQRADAGRLPLHRRVARPEGRRRLHRGARKASRAKGTPPRAVIVGAGDAPTDVRRYRELANAKVRGARIAFHDADAGAAGLRARPHTSCFPRARNRCPISCSRRRRPASRSSPPMSEASRRSSPARRTGSCRQATSRRSPTAMRSALEAPGRHGATRRCCGASG